MKPTHSQLVQAAAKWLESRRNSVIVTELATHGEEPDAIGWRGRRSTLIECKTTASDFRADAKKLFRKRAEMGMGQQRFYMAPPGVIKLTDLPRGWGLLEYNLDINRVQVRRPSSLFRACNSRHELEILLSVIKRTGLTCQSGINIKTYTYKPAVRNRAAVGVAREE